MFKLDANDGVSMVCWGLIEKMFLVCCLEDIACACCLPDFLVAMSGTVRKWECFLMYVNQPH
jgi:hypothetical protein